MLPSHIEDDCDECVPAYLRKTSASVIANALSLLPFAITFVVVGCIALIKLFPRLSTSPSGPSSGSTASKYDGIRTGRQLWGRPRIRVISALSFSLTLALSAVLTELILCEISDSFDASIRRTALNTALPTLLLLLIFFLPLLELYSVISSAGWRFRGDGRFRLRFAWVLQLFGFGVFALAFWTIGAVLPSHNGHPDSGRPRSSKNMIEGSLERLGVAGVTSMAMLSGFAAVSSIWQTFGPKPMLVTEADISRKVAGLETTRELLQFKKDRRNVVQRKMSTAPESSFWSKAVDTLRPNLDTQEMKMLEMELSGLQAMVDSLELSLTVLQTRRASQLRNNSAIGRLLNVFSHLFSYYCMYRIITTTINLIRRQISGTHGLPTTDPVTMFIALFAKHINPAMNQMVWAQHISFFLSSVILMTSVSAVIQTIHLFSRITPRNLIHVARSNAALVVAQICGTYVISSALMLRGTMPNEVKDAINDALGSGALDAGWVQKWFDMFFLGAVILTGQGLWIGRKMLNNDSWDDDTWDGDMEMGKRL